VTKGVVLALSIAFNLGLLRTSTEHFLSMLNGDEGQSIIRSATK
jgi:hypothetical protein